MIRINSIQKIFTSRDEALGFAAQKGLTLFVLKTYEADSVIPQSEVVDLGPEREVNKFDRMGRALA